MELYGVGVGMIEMSVPPEIKQIAPIVSTIHRTHKPIANIMPVVPAKNFMKFSMTTSLSNEFFSMNVPNEAHLFAIQQYAGNEDMLTIISF